MWMSLPLEYQDDEDVLNFIRLCRGESPIEDDPLVLWLELSEEDFGGAENCDEILEYLRSNEYAMKSHILLEKEDDVC